jgi:hypothetical protein
VVLTGFRGGIKLELLDSPAVKRLNGKEWSLPNNAEHFELLSWPTGNVFVKSIPKSFKLAAVRRRTPPQYTCASVASWRRPGWPDELPAQVAISNRRSNSSISGPFLPPSPLGAIRILDKTWATTSGNTVCFIKSRTAMASRRHDGYPRLGKHLVRETKKVNGILIELLDTSFFATSRMTSSDSSGTFHFTRRSGVC